MCSNLASCDIHLVKLLRRHLTNHLLSSQQEMSPTKPATILSIIQLVIFLRKNYKFVLCLYYVYGVAEFLKYFQIILNMANHITHFTSELIKSLALASVGKYITRLWFDLIYSLKLTTQIRYFWKHSLFLFG